MDQGQVHRRDLLSPYGDDAVRMMSTEPLKVLNRIDCEVDRANRPPRGQLAKAC